MRITVLPRPAEKIQVTWEGKTSDRWQQWALLEVDGLPTSFSVSRNSESEVLAPGEYELDPKSFSVANGRLTMNRVVLRAVIPPARPQPSPQQKA